MALFSSLRATIAAQFASLRQTVRRPRLALQSLEAREVPAVGGGFTAGGILGEYYDNTTLTGLPAFSRRDVRIDFNWGTRAPGGSNSHDFQQIGVDNFSVRWTGQLIPRFSETYTFHTTSDDGVRLWIKEAGVTSWVELVNNWGPHGPEENARSIALTAGKKYDVRMEYYEQGGGALAQLTWSSPSTPEEVIDPATNIGVNAVTYDYQVYADAVKSGRADWGDPVDYFGRPLAPTDGGGWPTKDAGHIFWEGQDTWKTTGVYQLRFNGRAEVTSWFGKGRFRANGIEYGATLPVGAGYDSNTNTTVAEVVISQADLFGMTFRKTQRTGGSPTNTGITSVKLMRPLSPGSGSFYRPDDIFDAHVKDAFARFTTLRYLTANFNAEREWWERKLPDGVKAAWSDRRGVWENQVMLANETGKDLYITIPINASDDYVRRLAKLMRFGSDGINPYDGYVNDARYPGLNPNLRVYVEWGNEIWNWAFSQAILGADAGRAAVRNNTPDGRIINFDGQRPNGDFRRWAALQTVQASNTFRSVWGDTAMGERVRVVLEYQYDNQQHTAVEALRFLDNYFNNGDGKTHVSNPKPVSYYIWGAGGASYFGASNPRGLVSDIFVPDGSLEAAAVPGGQARPRTAGSAWYFTGDGGVYRDAAGFGDNKRMAVGNLGAVPTTPSGAQAMYLSGSSTATITIHFPRAGTYALDFRSAAEFGKNLSNPLDFYFDDQRVTPRAADLAPNPGAWRPGTGYGRDPSQFVVYGTVPVYVSAGWHTFRIVGRGNANQTTLIDDVRVASTDAIFDSRLPGGGQAAGQVSTNDYQLQLINQAKYALAYGLKVVAYEGGWSLGGDHESVPLQSYAKYKDGRAAEAMGEAIDIFHRAGGELNVLGTYDQWQMDDAVNAERYPIVQAIDLRNSILPAPATAGVVVPGTLPVSVRATDAMEGTNVSGFVRPGEWVSWNVLVPTTGDYRVSARTSTPGRVSVIVDGEMMIEGQSGGLLGEVVRLTPGVHTVRVQSTLGEFFIRDITVTRVGGIGVVVQPPPVVNPASPIPAGWRGDDIGSPTLAGSTQVENGTWVVQGAGENIWGAADQFYFAHTTIIGDRTVTARLHGMDNTHGWAKAGVMMRAGTGESAPFAGVYRTPENGIMFEWRSRYRSAPESVAISAGDGPVWLRLVRRGNSFAAYFSTNGQSWNRIGEAQTISMPGGVQAGVAVTSHDVNRRTTARFTDVVAG